MTSNDQLAAGHAWDQKHVTHHGKNKTGAVVLTAVIRAMKPRALKYTSGHH
jgi:hypothetical protein